MRALCASSLKLGVLATVVMLATGCAGREEAVVTIRYTLEPSQGLPPGLTQVAIAPAELGPATDAKWSDITSDLLSGLVEQSREQYGTALRVADRMESKKVFDEADLEAAGLISGAGGAPAQLLGVQAFIVSKINIKSVQKETKKTVIDKFAGAGGYGFGGGGATTAERVKINQTITAQAKFQLVDAKTGESWTLHEDSVQANEETDPGFFMGIGGESDLSTEDEIAGALVERVAREFLAKLIPCEVAREIAVKSSCNEACAKGVALMRADMCGEALTYLEAAIQEDPEDHRAKFAAGVACETLGAYEEALKYYKRACVDEGEVAYIKAKKRLDKDIERIRRSG